MPKYEVSLFETRVARIVIEANNEDAAIEKAENVQSRIDDWESLDIEITFIDEVD